jgi:hypothetical protein
MIERRFKQVGNVRVFYAICRDCRCWVKSSIGQFGWLERMNRDHSVHRHERLYHAT